ncbi:MAG: hypothetical protein HFE63_09065 [Clostridiales bacterium]|nr:hypothetical protein [Clostridiales bacterium]
MSIKNINEILARARTGDALSADDALTLFESDTLIDEIAEELRSRYFSKVVTITAPFDSVGAGEALAGAGHRRLICRVGGDCDEFSVEQMLAYRSGKCGIRRIDACMVGQSSPAQFENLRPLISTLILPAANSGEPLDVELESGESVELTPEIFAALNIGFADIGLSARFTVDYKNELRVLLDRTESIKKCTDETIVRTIVVKRDEAVADEIFLRICAVLRIACPQAGLMISSNEPLNIFKTSATSVQIDSTVMSLDMTVNQFLHAGFLPSFCSACGREGRVGCEYQKLCREGHMNSLCFLNALLSLKEYLSDFASQDTRIIGTDTILRELYTIQNAEVRGLIVHAMKDIRSGKRDLHI